MNSNQIAAYKILEKAQTALKSGDKSTARNLAHEAVNLAPELEEVWLLMAALATADESIIYLEKALKINPSSERAKKGLQWAKGRVTSEQENGKNTAQFTPQQQSPMEQKIEVESDGGSGGKSGSKSGKNNASNPNLTKNNSAKFQPGFAIFTVILILLASLTAWAVFYTPSPVMAFINADASSNREHGPSFAKVNISRPNPKMIEPVITAAPTEAIQSSKQSVSSGLSTVTPSGYSTPIPTEITNTPEIIPTYTPIPTDSLDPTAVILPTDTAVVFAPTSTLEPTYTPIPTDVVLPSATFDPGSLEAASPTPLPTDTSVPGATQYVAPTPNPGVGSGDGTHWIDVDLTHQMLYAYAGNTLVNSFLVSTGTWQHPTVTGQFYVYVKYRYTDMSGPGYYLPNVPFTMYFYSGYAVHGTYWHSNFGTPMSHGCVNLSIPDAEWVYNFSSVGTLVNVHY